MNTLTTLTITMAQVLEFEEIRKARALKIGRHAQRRPNTVGGGGKA